MGLNTRSIFDPRWQIALGRVNEGAMTSSVLVRRRKPQATGPVATEWDYELGGYPPDQSDYKAIWTGPARVQPDKDWRARSYSFGDETTVFQAVRFGLPLAAGEWNPDIDDGDKEFRDEDQIIITANAFPNLTAILKYIFTVRNPLGSGVAPIRNVLCDVSLKVAKA